MRKRYVMKRYIVPAMLLMFLVIWLLQQNSANDSLLYTALVDQRSVVYDPEQRLVQDDEPQQQIMDPIDFRETNQNGRPTSQTEYRVLMPNASRRIVPVDLLNKTNSVIDADDNNGSVAAAYHSDNSHTEETLVKYEESANVSVNVYKKVIQGPQVSNDVISKSQRNVSRDENGRNASKESTRDTMGSGVDTAADANHNGVDEAVIPVPGSLQDSAEILSTPPLRQIPDDRDAVRSSNKTVKFFSTDSYNRSSVDSNRIFPPTAKRLPTLPRDEVLPPDSDDADASLIIAQQMALKNFVKSDVIHSADTVARSKVSDTLSKNSNLQNRYEHLFDNRAANWSKDGPKGPGHSLNWAENFATGEKRRETDELERFAEVPILPNYDLPMLKEKSNGTISTSSIRPRSLAGEISINSNRKSNMTTYEDSGLVSDANETLADTDDVMSSAVVLGEVNADKMYAVFSTTTENRDALGFIFLLPLTALAWKRVGFDSIVIIVGPVDVWNSDELFHFVLSALRQLGAVVVFLEPRTEKSVMISQVSRIFIANILRARAAVKNRSRPDVIDGTYLLTSDADIWPIYGDIYRLPGDRDIISLNSYCCGAFSHRNIEYRMLPMANVGMRIDTWRRLTRRFGESPRTVDDILTAVVREFGPVALRPVHKGENVGWFLDQMMVSLLVAEWTKRHGADRVKLIPRDVGIDRIDRNSWGPGAGGGVADKIDAHLLSQAYAPSVWAQILPLVKHLYGFGTDRYVWCMDYYDTFQKLFIAKYRSQQGVGEI